MAFIKVRPELIHHAAVGVRDAGHEFWRDAGRARAETAGVTGYGDDPVGLALREVYATAGPVATDYCDATCRCVVETARGMDHVATCYTAVERDNTEEVNRILDELGQI